MFVCSLRRARTFKVIGGSRTRSLVDHGHAPIRIGLDHQEVKTPRCLIFMSSLPPEWVVSSLATELPNHRTKKRACELNEPNKRCLTIRQHPRREWGR